MLLFFRLVGDGSLVWRLGWPKLWHVLPGRNYVFYGIIGLIMLRC